MASKYLCVRLRIVRATLCFGSGYKANQFLLAVPVWRDVIFVVTPCSFEVALHIPPAKPHISDQNIDVKGKSSAVSVSGAPHCALDLLFRGMAIVFMGWNPAWITRTPREPVDINACHCHDRHSEEQSAMFS